MEYPMHQIIENILNRKFVTALDTFNIFILKNKVKHDEILSSFKSKVYSVMKTLIIRQNSLRTTRGMVSKNNLNDH